LERGHTERCNERQGAAAHRRRGSWWKDCISTSKRREVDVRWSWGGETIFKWTVGRFYAPQERERPNCITSTM